MAIDRNAPESTLQVSVPVPPPFQNTDAEETADGDSDQSKPTPSGHTEKKGSSFLNALVLGAGAFGAVVLTSQLSKPSAKTSRTGRTTIINGTSLVAALRRTPAGREVLHERIRSRQELMRLRAGDWAWPDVVDWLSSTQVGREVLRQWE